MSMKTEKYMWELFIRIIHCLLHKICEFRHVLFFYFPDHLVINTEVLMDDTVAETYDPAPFYFRVI